MGRVDPWRKSCVGEVHPVQRPHGRRVSVMFQGQQGEHCCWSRKYGGEIRRGDQNGSTENFCLLKIFICYFCFCLLTWRFLLVGIAVLPKFHALVVKTLVPTEEKIFHLKKFYIDGLKVALPRE